MAETAFSCFNFYTGYLAEVKTLHDSIQNEKKRFSLQFYFKDFFYLLLIKILFKYNIFLLDY